MCFTYPLVIWRSPPSKGMSSLMIVTLFPMPEKSWIGARVVSLQRFLPWTLLRLLPPKTRLSRSPWDRTTCALPPRFAS
jgi:hypothetical protein